MQTDQKKYRTAADVDATKNLTSMGTESRFGELLKELFCAERPHRLIETGTYRGTGSTTLIAEALVAAGLHDAEFYSIEVNAQNIARAKQHLSNRGFNVRILHGLSVPRTLLPTREQIEKLYVRSVEADGVFVDHKTENRAELYFGETNFPDVPDDQLGACLGAMDYAPDFLLLDSGGHMGNVEFNYVLPLLKSRCIIALDDVNRVKHYRSVQQILGDERFEILERSDEKFGWCMTRFTPAKRRVEAA